MYKVKKLNILVPFTKLPSPSFNVKQAKLEIGPIGTVAMLSVILIVMLPRLLITLLSSCSIIHGNNALSSSSDVIDLDVHEQHRRIPEGSNQRREAEGKDITRNLQPRIIGGNTAQIGSYQYYGALNRFPPGCGASLVSSQFMITAAHCVEYFIEALDYVNLAEVIVGVACYDREKGILQDDNCGQNYETFSIQDVYPHPQYELKEGGAVATHDFALLKLNGKSSITPIRMDQGQSHLFDSNKVLSVAGMSRMLSVISFSTLL